MKRYLNLWLLLLLAGMMLISIGFADEKGVFIYESKRKRDPFVPLITPEGTLLKLEAYYGEDADVRLEGVIFDSAGESLAIINGKVVKKNDEIKGFKVLKIESEKVFLIKDGEILEIKVDNRGKR